ncbi:MAG: exodeoxyribonuclease VII large subunit [Sporanaerobacter sp.]|jgi:exodeoxyribonuclease VII large subunit|uniref:exodeoxyribonuclease VII large subunit n=1 Tax=Sporanaerobacter sp. TaxID=2010183 RepID=UPI003A0FBE4F
MSGKPLKVSEVNQYIKRVLASDFILTNLCVEGEISNFKHHYSGHMYFSLKDEKSRMRCVMFKSDNQCVDINLKDGMKVIASGYISVFERDGDYQFYVKNIRESGIGDLYIAFNKLKNKLELEGLFDESHKKSIPRFPQKIGIVTSSTGAAIKDIINVIKRRFPIADLIVYPVLVQGEGAPKEIIEGIRYFDNREDIDLIITGRGGGSIEELYAFNDESLARTMYSLEKPIISAVGHETDFTIADFVADLRAPTPSAAAELAVPELNSLKYSLDDDYDKLITNILAFKEYKFRELEYYKNKLDYNNPEIKLNQNRQYIDNLFKDLNKNFNVKIEAYYREIEKLGDKLNLLSPLSSVNRGYSILLDKGGKIVKTVDNLKIGEKFTVILKNGMIEGNVVKINKGEFRNEFK